MGSIEEFPIGKIGTPLKTNMEPENNLFEKETHLPNLHVLVPGV